MGALSRAWRPRSRDAGTGLDQASRRRAGPGGSGQASWSKRTGPGPAVVCASSATRTRGWWIRPRRKLPPAI